MPEKVQTTVYPTEVESLLMVHVTAQTMVDPTEAETPPKVSEKVQTMA